MPKSNKITEAVKIRVPKILKTEIKELANMEGITVSKLVRNLLVEEQKKGNIIYEKKSSK